MRRLHAALAVAAAFIFSGAPAVLTQGGRGQEPAVRLAILVLPPEDTTGDATPAP